MAIEDEPFELGDLRDDADGVGEALSIGQNRMDGAPGELAMADLAASGRAHAANLADRIRREVVVQQKSLFVGPLESVDILLVLPGAERGDDKRLRLAAGEESTAMGAGQDADLAHDRPYCLQIAAVDASLCLENARAHDLFLGLLEGRSGLGSSRPVVIGGNDSGEHLVLDLGDAVAALMLGGDGIGLAQLRFGSGAHARKDLGIVLRLQLPRLLRRALGELDDGVEHWLELLLAEHHGAEHHFLRELLGLGFDHQHGVGGPGHDEIERADAHLVDHRVQHILALDIANAGGADRSEERDAGQREGRRARDHRHDIRIVLHVVGEDGGDDLRLVLEARGEQRADRPVDEPRGERLLLSRASLALEIAAGDLARSEGLFLVVDGQREEVDSRLLLLGGDDGGENARRAIGGKHGAVSLAGNAPGLEPEGASPPFDVYGLFNEHGCVPMSGMDRSLRSPDGGKAA